MDVDMDVKAHFPKCFLNPDKENINDYLMLFAIEYTLEKPQNTSGTITEYFKFLEETRHAMLADDPEPERSSGVICTNTMSTAEKPSEIELFTASTSRLGEPPSYVSVFSEDWDESNSLVVPKSDQAKSLISRSMMVTLLAQTLSEHQLEEAMDMMIEENVCAGGFVVKSGMISDKFYIVEKGIFQAFTRKPNDDIKLIRTYRSEDSFGERALLDEEILSRVNVQAITNGTLWSIDRCSYRILLETKNAKLETNKRLLRNVPMLNRLTERERKRVADVLEPRLYHKDTCVYRKGDAPDGVYIIESGTVALTIADSRGTELEITRIGPGGIFGESSLVSTDFRLLSAFAVQDLQVQFLNSNKLKGVIGLCLKCGAPR